VVVALLSGPATMLVIAGVAFATHVHPANGGAKRLSVSLVPAFKACTSATTGTHGSPLVGPSCATTSTSAESATLTTGTGTTFKGSGSFLFEVFCTDGSALPCPAAGNQEDVKVIASLTDVRCKASIAGNATLCPSANSAGGKDYAGQIQSNAILRITDHFNTSSTGTCMSTTTCSATVVDLPFPVRGTCAATPSDATIGGACNINTTMEAQVPPGCACQLIAEGRKQNIEVGQVIVSDGGTDGLVTTTPNTVYARQGIYIP
jgi:hypothetical protein